jgi:histidinol-phosphatase (PHP family)
LPFKNGFAIQSEKELDAYCMEIRKLRQDYHDRINILLGLEIDYIQGFGPGFQDLKERCKLDYTIGSVHLVTNGDITKRWFIDGPRVESFDRGLQEVFAGDIKLGAKTYYHQINQMILTEKPDIIGHLDKIKMHNNNRYFKEDESWYKDLWMETLELIRQSGMVVEVNTRGIYSGRCPDLYPGNEILSKINEMGIPLTISSDAHHPTEVAGHYPDTIMNLQELGFNNVWYVDPSGWRSQPI